MKVLVDPRPTPVASQHFPGSSLRKELVDEQKKHTLRTLKITFNGLRGQSLVQKLRRYCRENDCTIPCSGQWNVRNDGLGADLTVGIGLTKKGFKMIAKPRDAEELPFEIRGLPFRMLTNKRLMLAVKFGTTAESIQQAIYGFASNLGNALNRY